MKSFYVLFFLAALILPATSFSQEGPVIKDLRSETMKFEGDKYVSVEDDEKISTAYFFIADSAYPKDYLQLRSGEIFTLFINGQLAATSLSLARYQIDSLRHQFGSPQLQIAMHFTRPANDFSAKVMSAVPQRRDSGVQIRPESSFRDFVVMAIIILLLMLVSIIRLNPKLTSDYFSISKIISVREIDDGQNYSRITSSSNILFYIFCSLMAGFCLTVIFEFTSPAETDTYFWTSMLTWILLSILVLFIFFIKILMVYTLSSLFGLRGVGGIHFFYWIRIILFTVSILTIILFLYFVTRGQRPGVYEAMLWIITFVLISLVVPVFLKLMRRAECSFFHLFSYICATEIIPFLITIKLLHQ